MIVTVCELPDDRPAFEECWARLGEHIKRAGGGIVVLPGMPFSRWFADAAPVDAVRWNKAVAEHDGWEQRLCELGAALVLGSRPIDFGNERYDEGFAWDAEFGIRSIHARGSQEFMPLEVGGVSIGLLIGEECWPSEESQPFSRGEVDIIAMPRCTRFAGLTQRLERGDASLVAPRLFRLIDAPELALRGRVRGGRIETAALEAARQFVDVKSQLVVQLLVAPSAAADRDQA